MIMKTNLLSLTFLSLLFFNSNCLFAQCPNGSEVPTITQQLREDSLFAEINRVRKDTFGIMTPLIRNSKLDNAARYHVQDMVADVYFCHETYDVGGPDSCWASSTKNLVFRCTRADRLTNFIGAIQEDEALSGNVTVDAVVSTGGSFGYAFSWLGHPQHRDIVKATWAESAGVGVNVSSLYGYVWALEVSAATTVGLNEIVTKDYAITDAYPNPFSEQSIFRLKINQSQQITIDVLNLLGQKVMNIYDGKMEANVQQEITIQRIGLPPGIYFYRVKGENGINQVRKIVVQ